MGKYLYSASAGGVYLKGFHGEIPADALPISDHVYLSLFAEPLPAGKVIVPGEDGLPLVVDSPGLSNEALAAAERAWRDGQLSQTDSLVARHRDEQEDGGGATTLSAEQYTELQAFRRSLRNWPEGDEFPLVDHRPAAPPWTTAQLQ
ncbi:MULTISPECIES: phage tail assembly chaperone [unclassified Pseudomonas]|uniref:phage tail assembly chaperone n=1 Tax=unclassified Pseudomonas TaxID=196821 RepID=UPI000CD2AB48|nr:MULTISPECIES: phage tail assembly chaperone [unclassified Pseudomonas]POA33049.1 phage tail protein [Pseudomonas sp. GW456-R21]POA69557.1 phage tail protein [Pseudomonas sp. GW460-R15]